MRRRCWRPFVRGLRVFERNAAYFGAHIGRLTGERRKIVAEAVTAAVVEFCASQGHTVADRPAATSFGSRVNAPSQRARPASFSR